MKFVSSHSDVIANIRTLGGYLQEESGHNFEFACNLLKKGVCFVVTGTMEHPFFAPSRFLGYDRNNRHDHLVNADKDGRDTNRVLKAIYGVPPKYVLELEQEYKAFCGRLGLEVGKTGAFGAQRKSWDQRARGDAV